MSIDEIVDFTYSRHKLLQKLVSKTELSNFLSQNKNNIIEVRENNELIATGFYLKFDSELHFLFATVKEGINGIGIMLRAIKDKSNEMQAKYVSWFNPELKFKRWKVKGGRQCQTQLHKQ